MTKKDEQSQNFEVLRELPPELTIEQVGRMVSTFPLLPPSSSWTNYINLNSILMTTLGTLILAGGISLFSANNDIAAAVDIPAKKEVVTTTEPADESTTPKNMVAGMTTELPKQTVVIEDEPEPTKVTKQAMPITEKKKPAPDRMIEPRRTMPVPAPSPKTLAGPSQPNYVGPPMKEKGGKNYDLAGFTGVTMLGSMDVLVKQGSFSVTAEGDEDYIEKLEITKKGDMLHISTKPGKNKKKWSNCENDKIVLVHVSMPDLNKVELIGSGDIIIENFKDMDKMEMQLSGSGDIEFESFSGLSAMNVSLSGSGDIHGTGNIKVSGKTQIDLAGSGDIHLHGTTNLIEVNLAGSGDIETSELEARAGEVNIVGSGDVTVNVTGAFEKSVIGSGDIYNAGKGRGDDSEDQGQNSY